MVSWSLIVVSSILIMSSCLRFRSGCYRFISKYILIISHFQRVIFTNLFISIRIYFYISKLLIALRGMISRPGFSIFIPPPNSTTEIRAVDRHQCRPARTVAEAVQRDSQQVYGCRICLYINK